VENKI